MEEVTAHNFYLIAWLMQIGINLCPYYLLWFTHSDAVADAICLNLYKNFQNKYMVHDITFEIIVKLNMFLLYIIFKNCFISKLNYIFILFFYFIKGWAKHPF